VDNLPGIVRCGLSKQSKNKYFAAQTRLFPYASPQPGRVAQADQKPFHKPAAPWTKGRFSLKKHRSLPLDRDTTQNDGFPKNTKRGKSATYLSFAQSNGNLLQGE
jgi:hypothetical protein